MRVTMEVTREQGRLTGAVTREDDGVRVPFGGVLEMVAAIEQLERDLEPARSDLDGPGSDDPGRPDGGAVAGPRSAG